MIYEDTEFPFDEIKLPSGDYFETVDQAIKQTGLSVDHVWSVTYDDHEEDENAQVYITGPSHHYCNLIGYIVTEKPHDGLTVYIENLVVI
tara:strand:- start:480 stop:749 length:270 start_codon:yes stop_codon:yes gene_type:complete